MLMNVNCNGLYNLLLYKTLILHELIKLLGDESVTVTTAAAVDIEKILAATDVENLQNLSDLKYLLAPLLCRNKEDQDKVYKVFEKLNAKFKEQYIAVQPFDSFVRKERRTPSRKWYLKNVMLPVLIILIALAAGFFLWYINTCDNCGYKPKPNRTIHIVTAPEQVIVKDTVHFTADIDSSLNRQNICVDWKFPDTLISGPLAVDKVINDTAITTVTAILKNSAGVAIDSNGYGVKALCEAPPSVTIDETDVANNGLKAATSNKKQFGPLFANPAKDTSLYTYNWFVDDSLYTLSKVFSYSKPYNTIKLVVNCNGAHCSADSLVAFVESTPALKADIKGNDRLEIQSAYNRQNILISMLLAGILPLFISFIAYKIIHSFKLFKPEIEEDEPGVEGPYKIEFTDQHQNINMEPGIGKLADVLRKRQVSDTYKLNIRKTIRSTVVAGGIPALEFTPLSRAQNFLAFIDTQYADSHLVKLFEYLVEKLDREEVDIAVYRYEKEPLFLSNEKLNQERIPLEKIAALYPEATLFIFGDAQYFLYPLKGKVKAWVTYKLNNWPTKFLITPYTLPDWDRKERLLIESNFVVLPADLSLVEIIDKIISRQIDIAAQKKEKPDSAYRSRFVDFQDLEILKNYLQNDYLMQWVCSLAVYPSVDWNLTIAMGKGIENNLLQQGININLVNYTNLLKLSRIHWLQDGVMNESLRVDMLTWLDKDAEALARQTLGLQLQLVEASISKDSLVKPAFDTHKRLNRFLLDAYHHNKITKEDEAFVSKLISNNRLDEGQEIYLEKGDNTLVTDPANKNKSISLREYFKMLLVRRKKFSFICAGILCAILMIAMFAVLKNTASFLNWKSIQPSTQSYRVNVNGNTFSKEVVIDLYYEPTHTKWRSQNIRLAKTSFSFNYDSVIIGDTTGYGILKLSTTDGKLIMQDSFKLDAVNYTINISEQQKTPVVICYKNAAGLALANLMSENLPANFQPRLLQFNFADSIKTSVVYFSGQFEEGAGEVSSTLGSLLGSGNIIKPQQVDPATYFVSPNTAKVIVFVNQTATCTPLAITALPQSLFEIWHGGTSNRLININLPKKVIYYSVNDTKTYGTYNIDEVCLNNDGVYKIITKTTQGYKLFLIKNIKAQSFDLSVCQDFAATKEELQNKDESYCDRFNTMALYYEKSSPYIIFLPITANKLLPSEEKKYDVIISGYYGATKSSARLNGNDDINNSNTGFPYNADFVTALIQKMPDAFQSSTSFEKRGPFERNYLEFSARDVNRYTPDCSKTFYSIEETQRLASPLIVCNLDLSKGNLTYLPKEIYTFTNLTELNLGTTSIPEADINALQKALPKCKIVYIKQQDLPAQNANEPANNNQLDNNGVEIGFITLDRKGGLNSTGRQLINAIAKQLANNKQSIVKFEANYTDKQEYSIIYDGLKNITNTLRKEGATAAQIQQSIYEVQQQQQQQQKKAPSYSNITINILGVNFPADFNATKKSAY